MLKLAIGYQDKLNKAWQNCVYDDKYKYFGLDGFSSYNIEVADNFSNCLQMVVVNKEDEVIGYLSANFDRSAKVVTCIGALNFTKTNNIFAIDFHKFLTDLFLKYNFRKIEWNVICGNPAEKIYNKIIKYYNGSIIGVRHDTVMIPDGTIHDMIEYELFKTDFEKTYNKLKKVDVKTNGE